MNLIEEAKKGDPDAFDRLMRTQLQKMYRIAIAMLQNEEDAADAIQEIVHEDHYFTDEWKAVLSGLNEKCRIVLCIIRKYFFVCKSIYEQYGKIEKHDG